MMSHFITACTVSDVSKDHSAFIFWVKQYDIRNAKNYTLSDM